MARAFVPRFWVGTLTLTAGLFTLAALAPVTPAQAPSKDAKGARNEARVSLRLKPSADAYLVLARLDMAEKNPAAAGQNLEHALALDPANAAATSLKRDLAATVPGKAQPQP